MSRHQSCARAFIARRDEVGGYPPAVRVVAIAPGNPLSADPADEN